MSKGTERERQCRDLYGRAGWMAWRPKSGTNPYAGDPDVFEEFDVMAIHPFTGALHGVQVKANGARGVRSFARRVWPFRGAGIRTLYAVPYDREGWRMIDVKGPGDKPNAVDERTDAEIGPNQHTDMDIGDGLVAWLQQQEIQT